MCPGRIDPQEILREGSDSGSCGRAFCLESASALSSVAANLPCSSVVGVGPFGRVGDRPLSLFLDSIVAERFTVRMLTEPYRLRLPVRKPDHGVLPIPYMIVDVFT